MSGHVGLHGGKEFFRFRLGNEGGRKRRQLLPKPFEIFWKNLLPKPLIYSTFTPV